MATPASERVTWPTMNCTNALHDLDQSLWLDNFTRALLYEGTLARYVRDFGITGLTSNPTTFERAIGNSGDYDNAIRRKVLEGRSSESLFFELALQDLTRAADLFRPIFNATGGVDGWVSLQVSPLLAHDAAGTIAAAADLHARAARPNLFLTIPGTVEGLAAIEASIFAGVPINITLLFSPAQYQAAAEAWLRGIESRIEAGLDPKVDSVASLFVSRWDVAFRKTPASALNNELGVAVASQVYQTYRKLLASPRWHRAATAGARPQRLLWSSTGTEDPAAPDTLYIERLAAPGTISAMREKTLLAFAEHGQARYAMLVEGGDAGAVIEACCRQGVNVEALAAQLQREGTEAFVTSWRALLEVIASRASSLQLRH
jgi:transaldolase